MQFLGTVASESELTAIVCSLEETHRDKTLFFRGQTKLYPTISSSRSRSQNPQPSLIATAWSAFASNALALPVPDAFSGQVQAILQHYGMPTYFVDVTRDPQVAAWFATHQHVSKDHVYVGGAFRRFPHTWHEKQTVSGYVLVLGVPDVDRLIHDRRLFDLSSLPATFVRPHRQRAWLMLNRPPTKPDPNDFVIGMIEVTSNFTSSHSQRTLFPTTDEDPCYARLLSLPFVETPMDWPTGDAEADKLIKGGLVADRALAVPEYRERNEQPNRKWTDIWISEPPPMRLWKGWRFDLSTVHPPLQGDIRDTCKVTLSPTAKQRLDAASHLSLAWPELGSNGLFFTYAGLDSDKFCDFAPPFYGVWLQKHEDLIVETPMEASGESLTVMPGHVYQFGNAVLSRQTTPNGCTCRFPDTHDARITAALRLSAAVAAGIVLMVPHPRISSMFVAFTEDDMNVMAPDLASSKAMMTAIFERLRRRPQTPPV